MTTGGKQIAPDLESRRRAFRAALALTGTTATAFAERLGVSTNHLSCVLRGDRASKRITEAVAAFVRQSQS